MSIENKIAYSRNPQIETDPIYQPDNFEFTPIDEMFEQNFDVESTQSMEEYTKDLQALAPKVNQMIAPAYYSQPRQGNSQLSFDTFDGFKQAFKSSPNFIKGKEQTKIQDPIISGFKSSGYDRYSRDYWASPFDRLGWRPDIDMEAYYNANTSGWHDFQRSWGPWWTNLKSGFMSGYRSIGKALDGTSNYFTQADYEGAIEMSEANRLGGSTRGGFKGGATNFFLNSGQTFGIISSIALEELALAAATAASEGAAGGALITRTGANFVRGVKSFGNLFNVGKVSRNILSTLRTAEKAKDFWTAARAGAKIPAHIFLPETMAGIKALRSGENTVRGLAVLAKASTYADFYRDVRNINLAMSEASTEAGFVYQDMVNENVSRLMRENGGEQLSGEQLKEITDQALRASTKTILFNAPIIYATNRLVLGTALAGFGRIGRQIARKEVTGFAKNMVRNSRVTTKAGKAATGIYTDASAKTVLGKLTGWPKFKAIGVKGSIIGTGYGLLRYSAASLGEGLQEVYQEGVQVGVVDYYSKLLEDPSANHLTLQNQAISNAIKSQMTAQGFETFLSGFLMGGFVQGPQRFLFEAMPEYIQSKTNPEKFAEYKKQRDNFEKEANAVGDDIQKDPTDFFSSTKIKFLQALETQKDIDEHLLNDNAMGLFDAQDDAAFNNAYFAYANGMHDMYIEQFEDIKAESDETLIAKYPQYEEQIKDGTFRKQVDKSIQDLKRLVKEHKASFDTIINPHNPSKFKKGTAEYNDEVIAYASIEHARRLFLLSKESFYRAVARRDDIEDSLKTSGILDKIDANDLNVLLSVSSITQEMAILTKEIEALKTAENVDEKLITEKESRLIALAGYKVTLEGIYDKEADVYDREKLKDLEIPFRAYLEILAEQKSDFVKEEYIQDVLQKLVDHSYLNKRARIYNKVVGLFSDPAKVADLNTRITQAMKTLYASAKEKFLTSLDAGINDAQVKAVLDQLYAKGVVPEESEYQQFIKTGDGSVLNNFYTEAGPLFREGNAALWKEVQEIIENYQRFKFQEQEERQGKTKKETKKSKSSKEELDDQLNLPDELEDLMENAPEINPLDKSESPFIKEVLSNLYNAYRNTQLNRKEDVLDLKDWINTTEALNAVNALEKVKRMWYVSIKDQNATQEELDKVYKNDQGFKEWILTQEDNPNVYRALQFGGINFNTIKNEPSTEGLDSVVENNENKEWIAKGPGVNIMKEEILPASAELDGVTEEEAEELRQIIYHITDNNGQSIDPSILELAGVERVDFTENELGLAKDQMDKILNVIPDNSVYRFDGIDLQKFDEVEGLDGSRFIVLDISGNRIKLIATENNKLLGVDRELAEFLENEKGFSNKYSKVEQTFEGVQLKENVSKLSTNDINTVYGVQFNQDGSSWKVASERLSATIEALGDVDLMEEVQVYIVKNKIRRSRPWENGVDPQNPHVNRGDKYSIGLILTGNAKQKAIDAAKAANVPYPEDWDGLFGFIRNDHFTFQDPTKTVNGNPKQVKLSELSDTLIERYIAADNVSAQQLRNKILEQDALTNAIDNLMKERGSFRAPLKELLLEGSEEPLINLRIAGGRYENVKDDYTRSVDDLRYQDYDGVRVIMVNRRNPDKSLSKSYQTDIKNDKENVEFIQRLEEELRQTKVKGSDLLTQARLKGGYIQIIKTPSGKIALARYIPRELTEKENLELFNEILKKAKDVRDGKVKEGLMEWNDNFNNKFFGSYNPAADNNEGGFVNLKVSSTGDIYFEIKLGKSGSILRASESIEAQNLDNLTTDEKILAEFKETIEALNTNDKVVKYNETADNPLNFGLFNLRISFPKEASVNQILEVSKTNLDARVWFGERLETAVSGEMINALKLVEPTKAADPLDKEYAEFVDTGKVAPERLESIANKIEKGQKLTNEKEIAIFNAKTAEINEILRKKKQTEQFVNNSDINVLEDTAYNEFKKGNFAQLPSKYADTIVQKAITEGREALTDREKEVLSFREDLEIKISFNIPVLSNPEDLKTIDEEIKKAEKELADEKAKIESQHKKTGENRRKLKKESKDYQRALNKLRDLEQKRNDNSAYRIMEPHEALTQEQNMDEFLAWAQTALPDFIKVKTLADLDNRIRRNGYTVGAFTLALKNIAGNLEVEGTIYANASNIAYHEAFHAVFRMLLTEQEQAKLYKIAKAEVFAKFKNDLDAYKADIKRFQRLHPKYQALSGKALENEYLEEYMAKEWEKFKQNPRSTKTNSAIKNFFNTLLEFIKSVLNAFKKNELQQFFEDIDAGKFRGGKTLSNPFTEEVSQGITLDAFKIIPYQVIRGEKMTSYKYLDPAKTEMLTKMIGQVYVDRRSDEKYGELEDDVLIDSIIDDFTELYDPEREIYNNLSEKDFEELENLYDALLLDDGLAVRQSVEEYLNLIKISIREREDQEEADENEYGRKVGDYTKDANQQDKAGSAPEKVRMFISSVAVSAKDMFGNTQLLDGTKIIVPVSQSEVLNGLMLAAMNETSDIKMLLRMYYFSRRNKNTAAVMDALFERVGIDISELENDNAQIQGKVKDAQLLQQFLTTFKNSRFDYSFQLIDPITKKVRFISASNRDAANAQIDYAARRFGQKFELFRKDSAKITAITTYLDGIVKKMQKASITNKELKAISLEYSKSLEEMLGIKLSPLFIEMSIVSSIGKTNTKYQEALYDMGRNIRLLTQEDLTTMKDLLSKDKKVQEGKRVTYVPTPDNLFIDVDGKGMSTRLKEIFLGNALFDENVGNTVFEDAEKNLIYAHQNQTFQARRVVELNDSNMLTDLLAKLPENTLLKSEAFLALADAKRLTLTRLSGISESSEDVTVDDATASVRSKNGKTYKRLTSKEFEGTLINAYFTHYNTTSKKVEKINDRALTPLFTRIMESSNTSESFTEVPIVRAIELGGKKGYRMTDEAFDAFVSKLRFEYNVIKDNFAALENGEYGDIKGYNDTDSGRGYKFFKGQNLLSKESQQALIEKAKEGLPFDDVFNADMKFELNSILNKYVEEHIERVLSKDKKSVNASYSTIDPSLLSASPARFPDTEQGNRALNDLNLQRGNLEFNSAQIFLSNWINTMALNELILGEQARLFKDPIIDPIKRAKMQNGAHDSVAFEFIPDPENSKLGIEHGLGDESIALVLTEDPKSVKRYTKGEEFGEAADAQSYMTSKGARYTAHGLGSLNETVAGLYNRLDSGQKVSSEYWDMLLKTNKQDAPQNSKKFVYGDGQTFLKTSTVVLTKEYTSYYDEESKSWKARPGYERLHNIREKMERYEAQNPGKIIIAAPVSASKMFKQRVLTEEDFSGSTPFTQENVSLLNAKDFGRQLINPSNKTIITDPVQIKTIITSEQDISDKNFKVIIAGKEMPIKDVVERYHTLSGLGLQFDYDQKKNLIFDLLPHLTEKELESLDLSPNLFSVLKSMQASLKASAASSNEIAFFEDSLGEAKHELNNPLVIQKFEQLFMSYFSKGVLSQKTPGLSLALKSSYGVSVIREIYSLEEDGSPDKHNVIRREAALKYAGQNLIDLTTEEGIKEAREFLANNPGKSIVVKDRLRYNVIEYNKVNPKNPDTWVKTNVRYAETMTAPHHKEVQAFFERYKDRPIPDVIAKMFAVRIPTQDKHSAIPAKVIDFLPSYYGSTAVFAEELIEISGADFDIDKVYAAIKEFYYKSGEFIEYGSRKGKEAFDDYVHYKNEKVLDRATYMGEALMKFKEAGVPPESKYTLKDIKEALASGLTTDAVDALMVLGLPITEAQYKKYEKDKGVPPYKAPITNELVDIKISLVGNTKLTESKDDSNPVSYDPADIKAVSEVWDRLSTAFPELKAFAKEEGIDIDNLTGQAFSHKNVKENAGSIGAVVPPATIINFLKEMGVTINPKSGAIININGKDYSEFLNKNEEGIRVQYLISNLITLTTDDAKERLLSKLGYVKKVLKHVEVLVGLGVSLEDATLIYNGSVVREIFENNSDFPMSDIRGLVKELQIEGVKSEPVTTMSLRKAVTGTQSSGEMLGILLNILRVDKVSKAIDEQISIFNLNKSLGQDFSELDQTQDALLKAGYGLTDAEFTRLYNEGVFVFDLRKAYSFDLPKNKPARHYIGQYIRVFNDIVEDILPKIFTSQSQDFKLIERLIKDYIRIPGGKEGSKISRRVHKDVLSYLTIKAYMKRLFETEAGAFVGGSLTNQFLYPNEDSDFNINKVIKDLRSRFEQGDNYFLDYYVFNKPADAANNYTNLNMLTTNHFGKLDDNEKIRIQNGFQALYGDARTRVEAMHIIHYIMVKDGFNIGADSIIDALTPFGLEKYLTSATDVFDALNDKKSFEEVFGETREDVILDMVQNYGQSSSVVGNLKTVFGFTIANPEYVVNKDEKEKTLKISWNSKNQPEPVSFPRFIADRVKSPVGYTTRYYRLVSGSLDSVSVSVEGLNLPLLHAAVYEEFEPLGSFAQTGIGFLYDTYGFARPTRSEMRAKSSINEYGLPVDDFSDIDAMMRSYEDLYGDIDVDNLVPFDMDDLNNLNNMPRTATENSIEVKGKNIADIEKDDISDVGQRPEGVRDASDKFKAMLKRDDNDTGAIPEGSYLEESNNQLTIDLKSNQFQDLFDTLSNEDLQLMFEKELGIAKGQLSRESYTQKLEEMFKQSEFTSVEKFKEHLKQCYKAPF